jgi:hypothetical protein
MKLKTTVPGRKDAKNAKVRKEGQNLNAKMKITNPISIVSRYFYLLSFAPSRLRGSIFPL